MFFTQNLIDKAAQIIAKAQEKNLKITCAESCTGGLLAALFTSVAGASKVFERGFVTYSNLAKIDLLAVNVETLSEHGAVSEKVAHQMAIGALKNSCADISVAITGIAGPDGGTAEKPVGTVYISFADARNKKVVTRKFIFSGDRNEVRKAALIAALEMVDVK